MQGLQGPFGGQLGQAGRMDIRSLTGIRGIAAIWVMLFHAQVVGERHLALSWVSNLPFREGWSGVDLFFVLSGFVLMLAHHKELISARGMYLPRFALLRAFRVYPLSFLVLILIFLCLFLADRGFVEWYRGMGSDNFSLIAFAKTAVLATRWFLPGGGEWNQPVWSLSVELLGYAAFPFLGYCAAKISRAWVALLASIVAIIALALFQIVSGRVGINDIGQIGSVARMLFCFVAGMCACRAYFLKSDQSGRYPLVASISFIGIVCTAGLQQAAIFRPFLFLSLVFGISFSKGLAARVFASHLSYFLGRISFPLYLVHAMILLWVGYRFSASSWEVKSLALCTGLISATILATFLHYTVEMPFQSYARSWISKVLSRA